MLFWPEISALGVFFNFDNERMRPPKYPSAPPGANIDKFTGLLSNGQQAGDDTQWGRDRETPRRLWCVAVINEVLRGETMQPRGMSHIHSL